MREQIIELKLGNQIIMRGTLHGTHNVLDIGFPITIDGYSIHEVEPTESNPLN